MYTFRCWLHVLEWSVVIGRCKVTWGMLACDWLVGVFDVTGCVEAGKVLLEGVCIQSVI